MKHLGKLLTVIVILVALFVPQMGEGLQLTKGWNENTVSADAELSNSTGAFQHLDQRLVNDDFDQPVDAAQWADSTNSSGSVDDELLYKRVALIADSSANAAVRVDKNVYDFVSDFRLEAIIDKRTGDGATADAFALFASATEPGVMPSATYSGNYMIFMGMDSLIYVDSGSAFKSWNGSAWVAAGPTLGYTIGKFVLRSFDDSGTMKWQLLVYDQDNVLQDTTTPVAWSATRTQSGSKSPWAMFGSPRTNTSRQSIDLYNYQRWGEEAGITYSTSSQIVNTDTITFEENFNSEDIQILVGNTPAAATEFKVYVQEDAGAFGSAINVNSTILAGETGWHDFMPGTAFTNHTSVTLKLELNTPNSDLQLQAFALKIKGVTISGGGGTGQETYMGGY